MQISADIQKAIDRKYPEPVVLVTTCSSAGNTNVMAAGWVAIASDEPLMFVLGIDAEAYTLELIRATRQFVVAFPNETMRRSVLYAGSCHGRGRDKISEAGLAVQAGIKVRAPLVAEAVANFECRLVDIYQPGNCPLVIGEVVAAHEHNDPGLKRLYTVACNHKLAGVRDLRD
ncbi:MAG: flavin reductase family protein [Verrucomicrobiota bacterium]